MTTKVTVERMCMESADFKRGDIVQDKDDSSFIILISTASEFLIDGVNVGEDELFKGSYYRNLRIGRYEPFKGKITLESK